MYRELWVRTEGRCVDFSVIRLLQQNSLVNILRMLLGYVIGNGR